MNKSKAIEYAGKLYVSHENLPIDQLWFIAKNSSMRQGNVVDAETVNLSHVWKNMRDLGCTYDDEVTTSLRERSTDINVALCTLSSKSCSS